MLLYFVLFSDTVRLNSFVNGHFCIHISTLTLLKSWSGVRFDKVKALHVFQSPSLR